MATFFQTNEKKKGEEEEETGTKQETNKLGPHFICKV